MKRRYLSVGKPDADNMVRISGLVPAATAALITANSQWGLERDYQVLCEMDADGSHAPEQLHLLLAEITNGADLVIGSRYVRSVRRWAEVRWKWRRYP